MYTNQQVAEIYRRIDQRLHISEDSNARGKVAQKIGSLERSLVTYSEEHKGLSGLKMPISAQRTKLNPWDVVEVILAQGEEGAHDYALQQLQRVEDYQAARKEGTEVVVMDRSIPLDRKPPVKSGRRRSHSGSE